MTDFEMALKTEAERQGEYYSYPDGRVRYVMSNQSLESLAKACGVPLHHARLVALSAGIVIT